MSTEVRNDSNKAVQHRDSLLFESSSSSATQLSPSNQHDSFFRQPTTSKIHPSHRPSPPPLPRSLLLRNLLSQHHPPSTPNQNPPNNNLPTPTHALNPGLSNTIPNLDPQRPDIAPLRHAHRPHRRHPPQQQPPNLRDRTLARGSQRLSRSLNQLPRRPERRHQDIYTLWSTSRPPRHQRQRHQPQQRNHPLRPRKSPPTTHDRPYKQTPHPPPSPSLPNLRHANLLPSPHMAHAPLPPPLDIHIIIANKHHIPILPIHPLIARKQWTSRARGAEARDRGDGGGAGGDWEGEGEGEGVEGLCGGLEGHERGEGEGEVGGGGGGVGGGFSCWKRGGEWGRGGGEEEDGGWGEGWWVSGGGRRREEWGRAGDDTGEDGEWSWVFEEVEGGDLYGLREWALSTSDGKREGGVFERREKKGAMGLNAFAFRSYPWTILYQSYFGPLPPLRYASRQGYVPLTPTSLKYPQPPFCPRPDS